MPLSTEGSQIPLVLLGGDGDTLYDKDGNYLSTALGHWPISVGMYGLKLSQRGISSEDYLYYGILRDVVNRTLKTEIVHHEGKKK